MTVPTLIAPRPSVDIAHHRIHEGNHFVVHKVTLGIAVGVPKYFLIIPPPVQPDGTVIEIHLLFKIYSTAGGTLEFFENPIITSNGTPLTIVNNNRRSTTTSQVLAFEDPIVASDGTKLFEEREGTATTEIEVGEFERNDEEMVLNPLDKYIMKFTTVIGAVAPVDITMELNWYDNRPSSPVPIPPGI